MAGKFRVTIDIWDEGLETDAQLLVVFLHQMLASTKLGHSLVFVENLEQGSVARETHPLIADESDVAYVRREAGLEDTLAGVPGLRRLREEAESNPWMSDSGRWDEEKGTDEHHPGIDTGSFQQAEDDRGHRRGPSGEDDDHAFGRIGMARGERFPPIRPRSVQGSQGLPDIEGGKDGLKAVHQPADGRHRRHRERDGVD